MFKNNEQRNLMNTDGVDDLAPARGLIIGCLISLEYGKARFRKRRMGK
jgi:hypothetical protein